MLVRPGAIGRVGATRGRTTSGGTPTPTLALTGSPDPGETGRAYVFQPTATGGSGTKTYAFSGTASLTAVGGSFNTSTGAITGTFTAAGTIAGTITVSDTSGSAPLVISIPVVASPSTVANLLLALDASYPDTITYPSGAVTTWNSTFGASQTGTASTPTVDPLLGYKNINGKPAAFFTGIGPNSQFSSNTRLAINTSHASGYTIFMVMTLDQSNAASSLSLLSGANGSLNARISSARKLILAVTGGATLLTLAGTLPRSTPMLVTIKAGSWGTSIRVNGVLDTSAAVDAGLTSALTLLFGSNGAYIPMRGLLASCLIYSGDMPSGDVAAVETYLTNKWLTAPSLAASPTCWANGEISGWADGTPASWAA